MAVAWIASSNVNGNTGTGDITPTLPAHQTDDILIVVTANRVTSNTCSTPSGWTLLFGPEDTTNWRSYVFWKRATSGSETNPLCDWTATSADKYSQAHVIRGAIKSGSPFAATAFTDGTVDPASCTGVTTTAANQFVLVAGLEADNAGTTTTATATDPSSFTQRHYSETATGADAAGFIHDATRAAAGATGSVSVDYDAAPVAWGILVAALVEQPPPGSWQRPVVVSAPLFILPAPEPLIVRSRVTEAASDTRCAPILQIPPDPLFSPFVAYRRFGVEYEFPAPAVETLQRPVVVPPEQPGERWRPPTVIVGRTSPPVDAPQTPVVVEAAQPPTAGPFIHIASAKAEPPVVAPELPPKPTIAIPAAPQVSPFIGHTRFGVEYEFPAAPPDARPAATVVGAGPVPQQAPFVAVWQPKTPAAAPLGDAASRPVVVHALQLAPPAEQATILWAEVSDWRPRPSMVIAAKQPPLPLPFIHVGQVHTDPPPAAPEVPPKPTLVTAPGPLVSPFTGHMGFGVAYDVPAPEPAVAVKPTVVAAQQLPAPAGWSQVSQSRGEPVVEPGQPPRPTVVAVTSVPAPGSVWVNRPVAAETYRPRPTVVTSAAKPPEVAAAFSNRSFGPPPPVLRRPATPIVFDVSRPPPLYGTAQVRRGFAEALPMIHPYARVETGPTRLRSGTGDTRRRATTVNDDARVGTGDTRRRGSTGDDNARVSTGFGNSL